MEKLELISTDALLEELKNRFDGHIFHGIKKKYKNTDEDRYMADWAGGGALCIGLCWVLKERLLEEYNEIEGDPEVVNE